MNSTTKLLPLLALLLAFALPAQNPMVHNSGCRAYDGTAVDLTADYGSPAIFRLDNYLSSITVLHYGWDDDQFHSTLGLPLPFFVNPLFPTINGLCRFYPSSIATSMHFVDVEYFDVVIPPGLPTIKIQAVILDPLSPIGWSLSSTYVRY